MGRPEKYSKEEQEKLISYLKDNYLVKGKTINEIAGESGLTYGEVKNWISKYRICRSINIKNETLTNGQIIGNAKIISNIFIDDNMEKVKCQCLICNKIRLISVLSMKKGFGHSFCCSRRYNLRPAIYSVDTEFFDSWNHDSAYIFGIVLSDGCIKNNVLIINLKDTDIEILEFIKDKIKYTGPIRSITKKHKYKGKEILSNQKILSISSRKIVNKLKEHGVIERKSGKEVLPDIPDKYFYDFLRGFFDGDGSLSFRSYKSKTIRYLTFSLYCSNKNFLEILRDKCGGMGKIYKSGGGNCFAWNATHRNMKKICFPMYEGNRFALKRKKDRWLEYLEYEQKKLSDL